MIAFNNKPRQVFDQGKLTNLSDLIFFLARFFFIYVYHVMVYC